MKIGFDLPVDVCEGLRGQRGASGTDGAQTAQIAVLAGFQPLLVARVEILRAYAEQRDLFLFGDPP